MTAQVVTAFAGIDVVGSGETPWMNTMIAAQSNADLETWRGVRPAGQLWERLAEPSDRMMPDHVVAAAMRVSRWPSVDRGPQAVWLPTTRSGVIRAGERVR